MQAILRKDTNVERCPLPPCPGISHLMLPGKTSPPCRKTARVALEVSVKYAHISVGLDTDHIEVLQVKVRDYHARISKRAQLLGKETPEGAPGKQERAARMQQGGA